MDAKGKTAIVTGGSRGVGEAIALTLAKNGADVAIFYRKRANEAQAVVKKIEALGRKGAAYQCDIANLEQVRSAFQNMLADFGRLDILVNNAALASWGNFIGETTEEEFERIIKADLYGPYYCVRQALPTMREQKSGYIISLSSTITLMYPVTGGPYAMAKAGVEAMTRVMAKEEREHNIRINAIAPGLVETEMGRKLMGVDDMKTLYSSSPFGRVCQPEDLANMVLFLVSEEGSYIHGQVIHVNGGMA